MTRDIRYSTVKILIETGHIKSFREIFKHIPRSVVYEDMGINYRRFSKLLANPHKFTLEELVTMSRFLEMDAQAVIGLAYIQYITDRKIKRKK